ncbi:uncharacterized protein KGF55_003498 [Candida pseudojiufengensis]|uniref:uncharacterized protein n=1 Tax=Candida pseudojiufengensis TaxID=497109 RepID=UPI002224A0E8|nr:uncharacterized protein KGF55_003498 [Candida pseudojiufengensis]KAI5962422.1 hypothetical protein KGF55_003498 [Candida pseudojiufengensis]
MQVILLLVFIQSIPFIVGSSRTKIVNEKDLVSNNLTQETPSKFKALQVPDHLPEFSNFQQFEKLKLEEEEEFNAAKSGDDKDKEDHKNDIPLHCQKEEFVIHSLDDLNLIIECETVRGNIFISEFNYPIITLSNLNKIEGNLSIYKSPELVRVESPQLNIITGWFELYELTSLALISFPNLKKVSVLSWEILPILSNVQFNNEIQGIQSITISDTSLTGFSGFLTNELKILDINNNRFLDSVECNVEKISELLHLSANSNEIKINLPNLKKVKELSINNVKSLSLNNLEVVENSLILNNNYFSSLNFPKLTRIGGTLSLSKHKELSNVEFPELEEIEGGLVIINNSLIEKINFLSKLQIIGGALEINGPISDMSFKNLKLIKGSAIVTSTSPEFDCNKWSKSNILLVVRGGKIECTNSNNEKITSRTKDDLGGNNDGSIDEVESTTSASDKAIDKTKSSPTSSNSVGELRNTSGAYDFKSIFKDILKLVIGIQLIILSLYIN